MTSMVVSRSETTKAPVSDIKVSLGPVETVATGVAHVQLVLSPIRDLLVVQAIADWPANLPKPSQNIFPGLMQTFRSVDAGKSWKKWNPDSTQGIGPTTEGAAVRLKDGTILIFEFIAEGRGNGHFVGKRWSSADNWKTLVGPEEFHLNVPGAEDSGFDDLGRPYSGMTFHRSVLELPGGDLISGLYCWFKGDTAGTSYRPEMKKFSSILVRSKDQGRHWEYIATIAADPSVGQEGFDEPVIVRISQGKHLGRLVCLMRVGRVNPLYQSISDDEGKTWSKPRPLNIVGVDPDMIEMSNGVLVCSFGHKVDYQDDGNFLAFSLDQGDTWTHVTRLSAGFTTAYTGLREVRPRQIFVAYDEGPRRVGMGKWKPSEMRVYGRTIQVQVISK